jgi:hypothetical protein
VVEYLPSEHKVEFKLQYGPEKRKKKQKKTQGSRQWLGRKRGIFKAVELFNLLTIVVACHYVF